MEKAFLCVDIGGTKTALALYSLVGEELFFQRFPTEPTAGALALVDKVFETISDALAGYIVVRGIIAAPGPLDSQKGMLLHPVMLGWENEPVVQLFKQKFGFAFSLINDCDAGALGVAEEFGFSKEGTLCYISISTGIGGGTVVGGKILQGAGNASDFGHIPVQGQKLRCKCGKTDCIELYSSGSGIEKRYASKTGKLLPCAEIASLARCGDIPAKQVFVDAGKYLDEMLSIVTAVLDPDIIVFGGGVMNDGDLLLPYFQGKTARIECTKQKGKQVLYGALQCAFRLEKEMLLTIG